MRIQFRERNIALTAVLRAQVQRRLDLALGRFGVRIAKVTVRISDGEVRRQGVEKECKIEVGLRPRTLTAEDADLDLFTAVERAANRASRSVARALATEVELNASSLSSWPPGRSGT
jgi:ribosomal subunit interface protein